MEMTLPTPTNSFVAQKEEDVYIWSAIDGVLVVIILAGNTLTILAVLYSRRLRAVISNLFIISLAVSDLIVGLTLPYHLAFYAGTDLGKSRHFCLLRFFLVIFACCVSIWDLLAIAIDRYVAICYPFHYNRYMTRRVALTCIGIGWIISTIIAAIPLFWNKYDLTLSCEFDEVFHPWYQAGVMTPIFSLIWIFMLLTYLRIWYEAYKHAQHLRSSGHQSDISDWKSVQVVLLVLGCFTICWMPYFIIASTQILKISNHGHLYKAAFSLAMANSGMNPLIYAWKNTNFRAAFGQLLRCKSPNALEQARAIQQDQILRRISKTKEQQHQKGVFIIGDNNSREATKAPIETLVSGTIENGIAAMPTLGRKCSNTDSGVIVVAPNKRLSLISSDRRESVGIIDRDFGGDIIL